MSILLNKYQLIRPLLTISILLLSLFLLTACAGLAEMDSHSKIARFQNAEDVYRASMRWGEWNNVFQLMKDKPDSTEKLKPPSDDASVYLEKIKVRDIEVLSSGMKKDLGTGHSKFRIGYRFENSAVIKTLHHNVSWWYYEKGNVWFTDTPLPKEFDLPESNTIRLSPK